MLFRMELRLKEAVRFFACNSATIEVVRDNRLEKVYFIILPFCRFLPKETKTEFNEGVNRANVKTKVQGLIGREQRREFIEISKWESK